MAETQKKKKPRRARGEGGITRRKDGLYIGKVELSRDPLTGKRRPPKTVSSMSHSECVKKLDILKEKLRKHGDLPSGSTTVEVWLGYWLREIDKSRPTTRAGNRTRIQYINHVIGKVKLEALTPSDVRKVETYIVRHKGLSTSTALLAYRLLSRALKEAERDGRVTRNVATLVAPPVKAVTKSAILTVPEAIEVIRHVSDHRLGSRWAAALLTGARQGELLGLEWDRVDFERNEIDLSWQLQRIVWVHGCEGDCGRKRGTDCPQRSLDAPADWEHRHIAGGLYWGRPKSRAGWRVIALVEPLRSILLHRREQSRDEPNPHGLVWTSDPKGKQNVRGLLPVDGSPIDPSRDNAAWHQVLADCGIEEVVQRNGKDYIVKRVRLHDARHTAVTMLYELGVPETVVQDIVGQSAITATRGYRHKSLRLVTEAMTDLGNLLSVKTLNDLPPATAARIEASSERYLTAIEAADSLA